MALLTRTSATAAIWLAGSVRHRYMPALLAPDGDAAAALLNDEFNEAKNRGFVVTHKLMQDSPKKPAVNQKTLLKADIKKNIKAMSAKFTESAAVDDPDALAAKMVDLFCIAVPEMDKLDNRRRVVATWSALLSPSVVMRQKEQRMITIDSIVDCGLDWLHFGYTKAAQDTYKSKDTRFIAAHPARMYQLVADTAHSHSIDHELLMLSLIKPMILSMGMHVGALRAVEENGVPAPAREKPEPAAAQAGL